MGTASRYWRLITLNMGGQSRKVDIAEARLLIEQRVNEGRIEPLDSLDADVQRVLWHDYQQGTDDEQRQAEWCFRCYISSQIHQVCTQLAAQFGTQHGFTRVDLLPFVLDDDGRSPRLMQRDSRYCPLAARILQTFDIERSGLGTWVTQHVKRHPELNAFLLQQGVYRVSDWAILNDTTLPQLQRILTEFHALTLSEVQHYHQLLKAYHQVYRSDRLQQKQTRGQLCLPPTDEQLHRMINGLSSTSPSVPSSVPATLDRPLTPTDVLQCLRAIATYLRQYRIHARGGILPTYSLDQPELQPVVAELSPSASVTEHHEFLEQYRTQFLACLDQALAHVIGDRLSSLKRGKKASPQHFTQALHLFHCEGLSMSEIAQSLGLQAQYQVTRLLKLKDFRADVRRRILEHLGEHIHALALPYSDASRLKAVDAQIAVALEEHVDALVKQAENEASVARHQPFKGLIARRICHYLRHRENCL